MTDPEHTGQMPVCAHVCVMSILCVGLFMSALQIFTFSSSEF